jgi:hypothetical protein
MDSTTAAIRSVLHEYGIEVDGLDQALWNVLYDLEDYDDAVSGAELKGLTQLQSSLGKTIKLIDCLDSSPFTYKNADSLSDAIYSLEVVGNQIQDRLAEPRRPAINPGSDNAKTRYRIYEVLRKFGVDRLTFQFATLIARILNETGFDDSDFEKLRNATNQQLRDLEN